MRTVDEHHANYNWINKFIETASTPWKFLYANIENVF